MSNVNTVLFSSIEKPKGSVAHWDTVENSCSMVLLRWINLESHKNRKTSGWLDNVMWWLHKMKYYFTKKIKNILHMWYVNNFENILPSEAGMAQKSYKTVWFTYMMYLESSFMDKVELRVPQQGSSCTDPRSFTQWAFSQSSVRWRAKYKQTCLILHNKAPVPVVKVYLSCFFFSNFALRLAFGCKACFNMPSLCNAGK